MKIPMKKVWTVGPMILRISILLRYEGIVPNREHEEEKDFSRIIFRFIDMLLNQIVYNLGVEMIAVKENFSTVTCSVCKGRTGPKGLSGLGVREWICSECGAVHKRDVNSARSILFSAQDIVRRRESPCFQHREDVNFNTKEEIL